MTDAFFKHKMSNSKLHQKTLDKYLNSNTVKKSFHFCYYFKKIGRILENENVTQCSCSQNAVSFLKLKKKHQFERHHAFLILCFFLVHD
jgi:hypothetical protein